MTPALPLALPWLAAILLAMLDGRRRWVGWVAAAALAATAATTAGLLAAALAGGPQATVSGDWPRGVGIVLAADPLGAAFALLSTLVILAAVVFEVLSGVVSRSFPALALFLCAGLTGLFVTGDVFNFYVFFELSMIAAYALSTYGEQARQLGAALIFAVVNLLGSFVFLLAVAALYHVTGTLEMTEVAGRVAELGTPVTAPIGVAILVALSVKLGLFPFHFWLPSVYASVRPGVAAILGGALANIGAYGVIRFGAGIFPELLIEGAGLLVVLGAASILYGSIQAVARRTAAEVLAYSSIAQVGYVLVALALAGPVGVAAAVLYALVNGLNKGLLFLSAEVRGRFVAAAFAIGALSVAGVPPSAGFLAKLAVFRATVDESAVLLAIVVFLGSALSFLYMLQIYQHDFWRGERSGPRAGGAVRALVLGAGVVVLALGAWPQPLLEV
ncbi:MAG: oxidoreductase, partial [Actinomycetota bacterium]|nr:oxidoreductase [Actinomycetota bacterium]